jgi:hypothetical protein
MESFTSVPNEEAEISLIPPTPVPNQVLDRSPVLQADEELLPVGALSSARHLSRIAERTRCIAERRWGNSHKRDKCPRSDGCGDGHWSEDEEDVTTTFEAEGEIDRDNDDDREDDDDRNDEDNDESDVTGICAWDRLGDSFEREATSICKSLAHESSILLTIV